MAQGNYGTPDNRVNIVGERWEYTPHTSDPASTEKGDEWLRVDMDSGDRIATLRFKHGTGSGDVWDIPVFPVSETPDAQIKKVLRIGTPNGEGFVPLYEGGGAFRQRAFQHDGARHGFHNSLSALVLPDSVVHHWDATTLSLSDGQSVGSWPDQVGSADLSAIDAPTYTTDEIGGNPVISYDGTDDAHESAAPNVNQPNYIVAVYQTRGTAGDRAERIVTSEGGDLTQFLGINSATDNDGFQMWASDFVESTEQDDNSPVIHGALFDGVDSELRINGQVTTGDPGANDLDQGITVAAARDGSQYMSIDVGEIIIADSPSTSDIGEIESYLTDKWFDYFADNGIGSPTYSSNQPQAIYSSSEDTTFVTYQGTDVAPFAAEYDHDTEEWSSNTQAGTNPLTDDSHGAPAMTIDGSGSIHIFYGSHGSPLQHARSSSTYDTSAWDDLGELVSEATYPHPVFHDGTIYLFYRYSDTNNNKPIRLITSTDGGDSWSSPSDIINYSDRTIYLSDTWQDGSDILMAWGDAPTAGVERYDVYYARYDTTSGDLVAVDGTNLGTTVNQTEADNNALALDSGSDYALLPRVRLDGSGNPHIIFNRRLGSGNWEYQYLRWDGSAWTSPETIATLDSNGSIAMTLSSASDITAYVSETDGSAMDLNKYHYDGASWSLSETVLDHETYGKTLSSAVTPMPYTSTFDVLFSEGASDFTTDLKVFGYGDSGFVN